MRSDHQVEPTIPTRPTFDEVYTQRWVPLVRFASLTTGSTALAEEIVQDAFAELHRRWDLVESPPAWVRAAVLNGCRQWVRRRQVERRHAPRPDESIIDPDGLVIREALKVLTPRQRMAVVLRYYEDLPESEIAVALGCRPGTVKSLLSRANAKLAKELRS